jgi:ribonuclease HI
MKKAIIFSDGGARGNPGPAGIGFVLKIGKNKPIEVGEYAGEITNNQAEYLAIKGGLDRALIEKVNELDCFLDSELVVKQLNGEYRVKNHGLRPIFEEVKGLAEKFEKVTFSHVRREKNKEADRMVNEAIDKHLSKG